MMGMKDCDETSVTLKNDENASLCNVGNGEAGKIHIILMILLRVIVTHMPMTAHRELTYGL